MKLVDPKNGEKAIKDLDMQYDGRHTDQPTPRAPKIAAYLVEFLHLSR